MRRSSSRAALALAVSAGVMLQGAAAQNETDWLSAAGRGVFTHYLNELQNSFGSNSQGKNTSWSDCVDEFDTEAYASSAAAAGARYAVITMMQGSIFLLGPNALYDSFTGYPAGYATSRRDLVLDLSVSLAARNISLMLYWTGDGPHEDQQASSGLGWPDAPRDRSNVPPLFAQRWAAVQQVYAERYGSRVKGWRVDGCYTAFGYNETKLRPYHDAIRAGNPTGLVALNQGVRHPISRYSQWEDYTCGESNDFTEVPTQRFVGGSQWHELSFLGGAWAGPGVRINSTALRTYRQAVNAVGGALTVDLQLFRNGSMNSQQVAALATAFAP